MSEQRDVTALPLCDRCKVEMERQPFYEGSESECWFCPCCRSKLRTVEMLQVDAERRAEELGLTAEEYVAHMTEQAATMFVVPTDRDIEHARRFAETRAAEWTPACPHDTVNPWLPTEIAGV